MIDWSWLLAALSITGTVLNVKKKAVCFYLWAFGEIFWIIIDLRNGQHGRVFLDLVHFGMAIWGIFSWRKEDKEGKKRLKSKILILKKLKRQKSKKIQSLRS